MNPDRSIILLSVDRNCKLLNILKDEIILGVTLIRLLHSTNC